MELLSASRSNAAASTSRRCSISPCRLGKLSSPSAQRSTWRAALSFHRNLAQPAVSPISEESSEGSSARRDATVSSPAGGFPSWEGLPSRQRLTLACAGSLMLSNMVSKRLASHVASFIGPRLPTHLFFNWGIFNICRTKSTSRWLCSRWRMSSTGAPQRWGWFRVLSSMAFC